MLYTIQPLRTHQRKGRLIPLEIDNSPIKIEVVDINQIQEFGELLDTTEVVIPAASPAPSTDSSSDSNSDMPRARKRAKLDHLSSEEKAQHRKMMNRISAQSARDRQKMLMKEQGDKIDNLYSQNDKIQNENCTLTKMNNRLKEENKKLKTLVSQLQAQALKSKKLEEEKKKKEKESSEKEVCCGVSNERMKVEQCDVLSPEPAVLTDLLPRDSLEKTSLLHLQTIKSQQRQPALTLNFLLLIWTFLQISTTLKYLKNSKISQNSSSFQNKSQSEDDLMNLKLLFQKQIQMEQPVLKMKSIEPD